MSEYSYRDLNVHVVWLHADSEVKRGTRGLLYSGLFGWVENVLERCCMTSAGCGRVEVVERWNDTVMARSKLLLSV